MSDYSDFGRKSGRVIIKLHSNGDAGLFLGLNLFQRRELVILTLAFAFLIERP
jgi:hypothetical protein